MSAAPQVKTMPLSALKAAPYNPREISKKAAAGLRASIKRFGLVQPIVWNKRSGSVVGGHQRVDAMKALGQTEARVVVVDLPDLEEKALNVTLNNPEIEGEFTKGLGVLLEEIKLGLPDVSLDLRLDVLGGPAAIVEDDVPEPPKVAVTQPGDLWTLGRHRLLCGDATNPEHVAVATGGGGPVLMITDPPYGVDYSPEWREEAAAKGLLGFSPASRSLGKVANDGRVDWTPAWALFAGDVAYVWHAGRHASATQASIEAAGFEIRSQLIWAKDAFAISRGAYNWQHEPCWYAVRKGRQALFVGSKSESTLWNARRAKPNGHSTQKPVECMARPIRNHDAPGVYDPFLGSGTTLIAAEQLDRTCYGLEIEPRYCDVIVERWQRLTGQKATRASR